MIARSLMTEALRSTACDMAVQALASMRGGLLLVVSSTRSRDILSTYLMGAIELGRATMAEEIITTIEGAAARSDATDRERTALTGVAHALREMYGKEGGA